MYKRKILLYIFKQLFFIRIYEFLPYQYHIQSSFEAAHSAIEPRVMRLFLRLFASYALNHIQYRACEKRESYLLFYYGLQKICL